MNDTEFEQLAYSNPWNDSPEFRQAVDENLERSALVASLQAQDTQLAASLRANAPETLKSRLLELPLQPEPVQQETVAVAADKADSVHSLNTSSRTWSFKMLLPLAAILVLSVAVVFNLLPSASNKALASNVMEHLYAELALLDMQTTVTMNDLNRHLDEYGGTFSANPEMTAIEASVVVDCWIEKEQKTHFHLVFNGQRGPVTLVVSTSEIISSSFTIEDDRFDGIIVGTPSGYLVVAGEKGEPVEELAEMFTAYISW